MRKIITLWLALGAIYVTLEVIWRNGQTHPSMLIVGGLCGVFVGAINPIPRFYKSKIILQSVIGALIVLAVEFVSGCVLNLWLNLNVWDYTGVGIQIADFWLPLNVLGQICLPYGFIWLLLMPFAIWAEDTGRWLIYDWDKVSGRNPGLPPIYAPYTLRSVYTEFFTGK